jgi:hypothetical protein
MLNTIESIPLLSVSIGIALHQVLCIDTQQQIGGNRFPGLAGVQEPFDLSQDARAKRFVVSKLSGPKGTAHNSYVSFRRDKNITPAACLKVCGLICAMAAGIWVGWIRSRLVPGRSCVLAPTSTVTRFSGLSVR